MTEENPGADVIEKDIVQTQNDMSDTVNELQEKLQPKQLLQQFVGNPKEVPAQVLEAVKRNPFAAELIGVGALWLVSGKTAKMPSFKRKPSAVPADESFETTTSQGGYRQRLSGLTASVKERSRSARDWSVAKHDETPYVTAIVAAAAGAIAALALPKTQIEREKLTPFRDTAVNKAAELKDQAIEMAQTKLGAATQPA